MGWLEPTDPLGSGTTLLMQRGSGCRDVGVHQPCLWALGEQEMVPEWGMAGEGMLLFLAKLF